MQVLRAIYFPTPFSVAVDVEGSDDGPSEAKRRKVDNDKEEDNGAEKCKRTFCLLFEYRPQKCL